MLEGGLKLEETAFPFRLALPPPTVTLGYIDRTTFTPKTQFLSRQPLILSQWVSELALIFSFWLREPAILR